MTAIQFYSAPAATASPAIYRASQQLLDILLQHRFVEVVDRSVSGAKSSKIYQSGRRTFFRNNGQCMVSFLGDGRVHVMYGPIALWNLHDFLSSDELTVLIAFSRLSGEHQELMRNYMAPRCNRFTDVMRNIPTFQVDWKEAFLKAFAVVKF